MADGGFSARSLAGLDSVAEEGIEHGTRGLAAESGPVSVCDLTQDLRFADYHRVETTRDPSQVSHSVVTGFDIK